MFQRSRLTIFIIIVVVIAFLVIIFAFSFTSTTNDQSSTQPSSSCNVEESTVSESPFSARSMQSEGESSLSGLGVECVIITNPSDHSTVLKGFAYVAVTPDQQNQGFQNVTNFGNCNGFASNGNRCIGMIFSFAEFGIHCFWMHNTMIPLEQVWISQNGTVTSIYKASPESDNSVCQEGQYVLETNSSSPLIVGDEVAQQIISSSVSSSSK